MKNIREFENIKTEQKIYALTLWREGIPITQIAADVKKSRETIYRWISQSDQTLSKGMNRNRQAIDEESKNKIIEAYVLLKCPSMKRLSSALQNIYMISFSPSQLRRALMKWRIYSYKPSKVFDSLLRHQAQATLKPKRVRDEARAEGIVPRSTEHSSHPIA